MLVLVCGGRWYKHEPAIFSALDIVHEFRPITELINGYAPGVDQISCKWAHYNGVTYVVYRAKWADHPKTAGFIRNQIMANRKPDLGVAFPGGNGTHDMIGRLSHAHIPVWKPMEAKCPLMEDLRNLLGDAPLSTTSA